VSFSADWVAEHNKVSVKDKSKQVSKDEDSHVKRRFHFPVLIVAGLVVVLLVVFFIAGVDQEEEKELPEKIDIFLYNNLGISPETHKIVGSEEIYLRDEIVDRIASQGVLNRNKENPVIGNLELSDAVTGFQKKATVYTIAGIAPEKRTLIEIRFQTQKDTEQIKIVESVPKQTATADELLLTQGGIIAEKDPVLVFTFKEPAAGTPLKAVYVIKKQAGAPDTTTFAAEEKEMPAEEPFKPICGDGRCVEGETYLTCCTDCGCLPGFACSQGACVKADTDRCQENTDCDDGTISTRDLCIGVPKTCSNEPITGCSDGDGYCPEGCVYAEDNDCPMPEPVAENITEQNLTGNETAEQNVTGPSSPPIIHNVSVFPPTPYIGEVVYVESEITDPDGKEDIERVWFEVIELAESHDEKGEMNDEGVEGDLDAGDDIYSAELVIGEHYLTGEYHVRVYAKDMSGNQEKRESTFQVIGEAIE
jgi:hypothetical protein